MLEEETSVDVWTFFCMASAIALQVPWPRLTRKSPFCALGAMGVVEVRCSLACRRISGGEGLGRLSFWRLRPVGMRVLSGWRSS